MQYKRNNLVLERAAFRVNGDVIDVFPAEHESSVIRIEMLDDEIERIVEFDPLTGEHIKMHQTFTFFPKNTT